MNKYVFISIIGMILYFIGCEIKKRLIFHPNNIIQETYGSEFYVNTDDGKVVHGIYVNNNKKKTILFCHGNAGNVSFFKHYSDMFNFVNIVFFDYSGFGKSIGHLPNLKILKENVLSIWNYITQDLDIDSQNVIIMGESLGGVIAIWLTGFLENSYKIKPSSLIVQSTFLSMSDLIPNIPIINFGKLFTSEFDSCNNLKMINDNTKILILHSIDDEIVPYKNGILLYNSILADKVTQRNVCFLKMNGTHNNLLFDKKYIDHIKYFCK